MWAANSTTWDTTTWGANTTTGWGSNTSNAWRDYVRFPLPAPLWRTLRERDRFYLSRLGIVLAPFVSALRKLLDVPRVMCVPRRHPETRGRSGWIRRGGRRPL